jgi:hypothetical protein
VFENRVLRMRFGPNRNGMTGEWRKLHNEEHRDLYSLSSIIKVIIRMDLGEVGWHDVGWIGLAKDRHRWRALVNSVLNLRVP